MISSAAASVSGSLALGLGAQAAPADDAAVSTDFAALLGSTVASGVASDAGADAAAGQDGMTDQAALLKQAIGKQMRQASGNAAGKKLPQGMPDPAEALTDTSKLADGAAKDTAAPDETAVTLPAITTEIVLPGFVVPISMQMPQTPAATAAKGAPANTAVAGSTAAQAGIRQSTTDSLAQAAAAQAIRSPLPGATEAALAAKAGNAGAPAQQAEAKASTAPNAASPALSQATTSLPVSLAATPAKADGTVAVSAASGEPALAVAILPNSPTRADDIRVTIKPPEQPALAATSTSAQLASAQVAGQVIGQSTGRAAATTKTTATKSQQPIATPSTDSATPAQAAANASQPNVAAAQHRESAAQEATPLAADAPAALAEASAADAPNIRAQTPAATMPQPLFGLQDGQSFSQAAAPVTSASTASGIGQTGHDFAALVDRLVEARDAASPASVHAAITHSEFGQVSLRFDQDANGLSVAMSSADPEFARAVHASSAQSQMSGNNNDRGSGAPRQDTSGQQQATGSPSSQSQAQSSASGRGDRNSPTQTDNRAGRNSGRPTQDVDTADTRGGIYA